MHGGAESENSDDALVRIARDGDETAFARLQAIHRPWVVRLIGSVVRDADLAEDLTQEAFCRVYRHRDGYDARGQFVPWLKRIALNLARNALRDGARDRERVASAGREAAPTGAASATADPAAALESRLLRQEVRAALGALPREQREAALLHYFAGSSVREIARAAGCPEGTVKSRLFQARQTLRRALGSEIEER